MTAAKHALPDPAEVAQDRDQLLTDLGVTPVTPVRSVKWWVLRQCSHLPDERVCGHRWEWQAEACAWRAARRSTSETGVFYTVRRADA